MEEIRKIVDAYYENCTPDFQKKVQAVFNEMTTDRNGKIYREEYENYVGKPIWPPFMDLDRNNDGLLDFKDIMVFFYMKYVRDISHCNNCADNLISMYFTCVECLDKSNNSSTVYNATYDLCINCYSRKTFNHGKHKNFLDNRALVKYLREDLRSRSTRKDAANMASSSASRGNQIVPAAQSSRSTRQGSEGVANKVSRRAMVHVPQVSRRTMVHAPQVPTRASVPPPQVPSRVPSRASVPPPQVPSRASVPPPQVSSRASIPPPQVPSRASVPTPHVPSRASVPPPQVPSRASVPRPQVSRRAMVHATQVPSRAVVPPPQVPSCISVPPPQVSSCEIVPPPQRTRSTRQGSKDVVDKSSSSMEIVPRRAQEGPSNVGFKLFAQALGIVANATSIAALIAAGSCTIM